MSVPHYNETRFRVKIRFVTENLAILDIGRSLHSPSLYNITERNHEFFLFYKVLPTFVKKLDSYSSKGYAREWRHGSYLLTLPRQLTGLFLQNYF